MKNRPALCSPRPEIQMINPKREAISSPQPLYASLALDDNALHMNVTSGSKVSNLLKLACKKFEKDDLKQITWCGNGDTMGKVIAAVEIMKNLFKVKKLFDKIREPFIFDFHFKIKDLFQINKIGYMKCDEPWKAKTEELLEAKVTKDVPSICIVLSKTPLDSNELGYQTTQSVKELFTRKVAAASTTTNSNKRASLFKKDGPPANFNDDGAIYVKKKKPNDSDKNNKKK